MMAHVVDWFFVIILILIPIFLVIRLSLKGFIIGVFFVWVILIINGLVLNYLDPHREGGIIDGITLIFGWIIGLLYSGAIYLVKLLFIYFSKYKNKCK